RRCAQPRRGCGPFPAWTASPWRGAVYRSAYAVGVRCSPMRNFAYALLALLLTTNVARAQDFEAAAKHFGAAQEAFGKKFFQTAVIEQQAAYEITKDPILLYNIGEAWQKAGEGKKAVASYKAYLKAQPAAQDKAEVAKRVRLI